MSAHIIQFFFFSVSQNGEDLKFRDGYRFSEMNRKLSSTSDSNIVTRLASRSITGHELPIQVHQHYGLQLHLILHSDNFSDSKETCIRRAFRTYHTTQDEYLQLQKSALQRICSCIYGERRDLAVFDKVEKCLIARPFKEGVADWMWEQKFYQDCMDKQRDVCCCRQVEVYYELIG